MLPLPLSPLTQVCPSPLTQFVAIFLSPLTQVCPSLPSHKLSPLLPSPDPALAHALALTDSLTHVLALTHAPALTHALTDLVTLAHALALIHVLA